MMGEPKTLDVAFAEPIAFLLAVLVSVGVGLVVARLERRATTREDATLDRLAVTASGF
jgi:hypothetical protein